MFRKLQNIDSAFRLMRSFSLLFLAGCTAVSGYALYVSYRATQKAQNKVYLLSGGQVLEAYASDRRANLDVEVRDHVRTFHHYFFTLDPDEAVIKTHVTRALYLADRTAKQAYDNLKEAGYFVGVVSGNISQRIEADSIVVVTTSAAPYFFRYFGKQTITRPTSLTLRSLVTEGYLREVSRSDHNPHGFLVERWRTLENKDLHTKPR